MGKFLASILLAGLLNGLPAPPAQAESFRGMVAAAHPLAANAGMQILEAGGTAMDAAVVVQTVLGLVEPQSSGLGGGGFLLHYEAATGELTSWDGRETAPLSIRPDVFASRAGSLEGFLAAMTSAEAVGVPGMAALLETTHSRYGKLPWETLFNPALDLAENGFAITPRLFHLVSRDRFLPANAAARHLYFQPGAGKNNTPKAKPAGTVLKNPAYAKTLKHLASEGAESFYTGVIGQRMIADLKAHSPDQLLTQADLENYTAKQRPNLCGFYRFYKVCSIGPPSSGGVALLQILGLLSRFNMSDHPPESEKTVHLITEATRLAFADRAAYLADGDFVNVPVRLLLDKAYLAQRSRLIRPDRVIENPEPGRFEGFADHAPGRSAAQPSTTHFAVLDAQGNGVSMTSSVEAAFGSRIMSGGMFLNNQLTDFSFLPEIDGKLLANSVAPGKRPRSSMTPVMIFHPDGSLFALLGSPGGPKIISYVAQTVIALIDHQKPMQAAIDLPRHVTTGKTLELENGLAGLAAGLERLGHDVLVKRQHSGLHGIRILKQGPSNSLKTDGGADPRREGHIAK